MSIKTVSVRRALLLSMVFLLGLTWLQIADRHATASATTQGSAYVPLTPYKLADSRSGESFPSGPLVAGTSYDVQVTASSGATDRVPVGATAVVLSITAIGPTNDGSLTIFPSDESAPTVATMLLNQYSKDSNTAIVPLSQLGRLRLRLSQTNSQVVLDVTGYYAQVSGSGNTYYAAPPTRVAAFTLGAGQSFSSILAGANGIPANVSAVAVNVSAVQRTAASGLTVWPTGDVRPSAFSLYSEAGDSTTNLLMVKPGLGGQVDTYLTSGQADVTVDIVGYYVASSGASTTLTALSTPTTVLSQSSLANGQTTAFSVNGVGDVPAEAQIAVLDIEATNIQADSTVTAWSTDYEKPPAGGVLINAWVRSSTTVLVPIGSNGGIQLSLVGGPLTATVRVTGYLSGAVLLPAFTSDVPTNEASVDTNDGSSPDPAGSVGDGAGDGQSSIAQNSVVQAAAALPWVCTVVASDPTKELVSGHWSIKGSGSNFCSGSGYQPLTMKITVQQYRSFGIWASKYSMTRGPEFGVNDQWGWAAWYCASGTGKQTYRIITDGWADGAMYHKAVQSGNYLRVYCP